MAAKRGVVATADPAQSGAPAAGGDAVRLDDSASAGKAPRTER
ncbi:TetR family transcriptional regulator, partial [Pseudomonas sp. GW460-R15]